MKRERDIEEFLQTEEEHMNLIYKNEKENIKKECLR